MDNVLAALNEFKKKNIPWIGAENDDDKLGAPYEEEGAVWWKKNVKVLLNTFQKWCNELKQNHWLRILPGGGPYEDDGKLGGP